MQSACLTGGAFFGILQVSSANAPSFPEVGVYSDWCINKLVMQ